MAPIDDLEFWEWLKEKEREESKNDFEPVPLYISVEMPTKPSKRQETEDIATEYEIDYDVDENVIYQF